MRPSNSIPHYLIMMDMFPACQFYDFRVGGSGLSMTPAQIESGKSVYKIRRLRQNCPATLSLTA